ncbi:MAG: ABC transporter ATP-binding protein [Rudaea sp.]
MQSAAESRSRVLVRASGLGKAYPKVFHRRDRLRALARLLAGRGDADAVSVLEGVNLHVERGQSLGLIGENGAGKSTLLKLLTGVLTPTAGSVTVDGRVGALLELGAGFHTEYSGRDNIALSATLYGLSAEETRAKLPEIVAFADIGDYIDEPVKHYSSGMTVRLGFAIVAALRPDLLITDEVLAVGDESFQKKCVRWMEDYLAGGGTLILVSHSMYHIQKLCRQAIWLRHGRVEASGDVFEVTQAYLAFHERKTAVQEAAHPRVVAQGTEFELTKFAVNGQAAEVPILLEQGDGVTIRVEVVSRSEREPVIAFGLSRADGTSIYGISSDMDGQHPVRIGDNHYAIELSFASLPLLPGSYLLRAHAMDTEAMRLFDTLERGVTVRGKSREFGMVRLTHVWNETPAPT